MNRKTFSALHIWATLVAVFTLPAITWAQTRPLMKNFIGVNTRVNDEFKYMNKFLTIREYHEWASVIGFDNDKISSCPQRLLTFNPSQNTSSLDNFDNFYLQLSGRVSPSMKWLAPEMRGLKNYSANMLEQKPFCLAGLPGVGDPPGAISNRIAEDYFKIGAVLRNASLEDLNTATRYFKCYVHYVQASTYKVRMKVNFPDSTVAYGRTVRAWVDRYGDGVFNDNYKVNANGTTTLINRDSIYKSGKLSPQTEVTIEFNLPVIKDTLSFKRKRYFRLRLVAISNGDAYANVSNENVFFWDVAFTTNSGVATFATYDGLDPAAVNNKGRITEVEILRGNATVYKKRLKSPTTSKDYNYFNDGNLALMYKGAGYKFTLDNSAFSGNALVSQDFNFAGGYAGTEETSINAPSGTLSGAWTNTGLSVMRVRHRNSAGTSKYGTWEYPVLVRDTSSVANGYSTLLSTAVYMDTITVNTGAATPVFHKVLLPVEQEAAVTYKDYTKWLTAMTARYGNKKVCLTATDSDSTCVFLKSMVDPADRGTNWKSGQKRIKWMEPGNEPDKFWYDKEFRDKPEAVWQMLPNQYAALLHATYDGANKSNDFKIANGKFLGVRNIDTTMKVAFAGISDLRGRYITEMLSRCESLRSSATRKLPFDIFNLHHYTSTNVPIGSNYTGYIWPNYSTFGFAAGSVGACPECAGLKARYSSFFKQLLETNPEPIPLSTTVKNELTGGMEYWVSEFGYDTNLESAVSANIGAGTQSHYTTQAQWLVRSFLELAAVEYTYPSNSNKIFFSKAMMFDMRDEGNYGGGANTGYSPGSGLYTHSGLVSNRFKPKRSWYHVQTLKNVLGNSRFRKDVRFFPLLSDLSVTPTCDGGTINFNLLSIPPGTYKVVYAKKTDIDAMLTAMGMNPANVPCDSLPNKPFDYLGDNRFSIYSDIWAPTRPLVLNGLQSNTDYRVFIFYTDVNGVVAAKPCVLCFNTNSDAPCFINPCLSLTQNTASGTCGTFGNDYKNLLISPGDSTNCVGAVNSGNPLPVATCANYTAANGIIAPGDPALFDNGQLWSFCDPYELTVTFKDFVQLDAIKFYHGTGNDDVEIYYTCCDCTTRQYLATFRPNGMIDHWVTIFENMPAVPVKKLHFAKVGRRGVSGMTSVSIGKLHFCGVETLTCALPGKPGEAMKGGTFERVRIDKEGDQGVTVAWSPVTQEKNSLKRGLFQEYQIWVAPKQTGLITQFDSENPMHVQYYPGTDEASISLGDLLPGAYDVLIRVPLPAQGCSFAPQGDISLQSGLHGLDGNVWADTLLTFRVEEAKKEGENREQKQTAISSVKADEIAVFPNPTNGTLTVQWSREGFNRLEFWGINGALARTFEIEITEKARVCDLTGLPPGTYLARLRGRGEVPLQRLVVLMKP